MKKYVSEGKFKRICEMPEAKLFIATKVVDNYDLSMEYNCISVGGTQTVKQTLIVHLDGFYYFQYEDWRGNIKHYRQTSLPSYLGFITGIDLLIARGGFHQHEQKIRSGHLFGAKIEFI